MVMPATPTAEIASRTRSTTCGFTTAVTSFMRTPWMWRNSVRSQSPTGVVVGRFGVQNRVEAARLGLGVDPQPHRAVQQRGQHPGGGEGARRGDDDAEQL